MSRFTMLFAFLLAFCLASPLALAGPPEEDTAAEKADAKADTKTDAPKEEAKAPEGDKKAEKADEKKGDEAVPTDDELVKTAKEVIEAARSHEWALMVAGIIMLLLGLGRKFKLLSKVPKSAVPWVSMALGILAVVGDNLVTGGEITMSRLVQGVLAGMAASGAWGMVGKHVLASKKKE